jgi:hypothetical protein
MVAWGKSCMTPSANQVVMLHVFVCIILTDGQTMKRPGNNALFQFITMQLLSHKIMNKKNKYKTKG